MASLEPVSEWEPELGPEWVSRAWEQPLPVWEVVGSASFEMESEPEVFLYRGTVLEVTAMIMAAPAQEQEQAKLL